MRALCCANKLFRYLCFPSSSSVAERFKIKSAPDKAKWLLGGIGAHTSSQISTPNLTPCDVKKSFDSAEIVSV